MDSKFLNAVVEAAEKSGKNNRFCTLKSCTALDMLAAHRGNQIYKIAYCQFQIGSNYYTRETNRQGKDVKQKRKSYFGKESSNGVVRYLLSKPENKYIWAWKSNTHAYKSVYVNSNGELLDYKTQVQPFVRKRSKNESPQRVFHFENVFYMRMNGQEFKSSEFDLYDEYLQVEM